jgi:hypothetical protein
MDTFAEKAIVDYRLSFADQGKKLPSFVSVYSKQMEVCRFFFPFPANKRKLPFFVSSICRLQNSGNMETWKWRLRDMET